MTKDEFDTLVEEARERNGDWSMEDNGEWSREAAIDLSFMEAQAWIEAEAEKRELEQLREIIENSHQERSNDQ